MNDSVPAAKALERLKAGNQRFVEGKSDSHPAAQSRGMAQDGPQRPMAIILGCSDSRVPAEFIFDQGFGDLFVIRVAGNVVAPTQVASVEFAASRFDTRLVVVLGHSQCGAVQATLDGLRGEAPVPGAAIHSIVERIRPAVADLLTEEGIPEPGLLMAKAVRANIRASVSQLRDGSAQIRHLLENNGLEVVGAEYSLETGVVEFFE